MSDNGLAIARSTFDSGGRIRAGRLLSVRNEAFAEGYASSMAICTVPGSSDILVRAFVADLLPMSKYLLCQPMSDFWALSKISDFGRKVRFLQTPATVEFGDFPFRFESLGEMVYFMEDKGLDYREFSNVRFKMEW